MIKMSHLSDIYIPRCLPSVFKNSLNNTERGQGLSLLCSYLVGGTFVSFEFFPCPVLQVFAIRILWNLPNGLQNPPVEKENLLPSDELCRGGEMAITAAPFTAQGAPLEQNKL